jgi:hypothetical protein
MDKIDKVETKDSNIDTGKESSVKLTALDKIEQEYEEFKQRFLKSIKDEEGKSKKDEHC